MKSRNDKNVLVMLIGIFIFIMVAGGVSYAYFVYKKDVALADLTSGSINISFTNGTNNISETINQPVNDELGKILPYYLDFSVNATTDTESIYYEIYIVPNSENTLDNKYVNVYMTDQNNNVIHNVGQVSLLQPSKVNNGYKIHSETLVANNDGSNKNHTKNFRLRVFINDSFKDPNGGEFNYSIYMYAENTEKVNFMNGFPSEITSVRANIKEIYFKNEPQSVIDSKCQTALDNGGVCKDITYQNQGKVMAWLEPIEDEMYIMYVESEGKTYLNTGYELFSGYTNVEKFEFNNVDTSRVTSMMGMFNGSGKIEFLDLKCFDTQKVTDMVSMLKNTALISVNLDNFDIRNVTSIDQFVRDCKNIVSINLSNFDTRNVVTMQHMFNGCSSLTTLDISSFDTQNVTNMYGMFNRCSNLETIYVSESWKLRKEIRGDRSRYMFYADNKLKGGKGTKYSSAGAVDGELFAKIDNAPDDPGYLTDIKDKPAD